MTVSDQHRHDEKAAVLERLLQLVGDQDVRECVVNPAKDGLGTVLPTTWRELLDEGLIDDKFSGIGFVRFRLTSAGWLWALTVTRQIDGQAFKERCTRLVMALKAVVKGRRSHRGELVRLTAIAASSGLSVGWIANAIRSAALSAVFPHDSWDVQFERDSLRVSPTFGLSVLDN